MTGIIEIEVLGQKRSLRFNNFAKVEISKAISLDATKILDHIQEMAKENHLLLLKLIVWAGHCGDCYRRQDTTDLSKEDIGDWVATASDEVLHGVFSAFLESEGVGIPAPKKKARAAKK